MNLYNFFNPQSIAVIGASDQEGKIGNILIKNLLDLGYEGKILPINPKYEEIAGLKCWKSIEEIKEEIDLIIVAVPAALVYKVIDDSTERSKNFVVISAGFSETGQEGKKLETKLKKIAQDRELNILGPNCLGFINPSLKLNASFASGLSEEGGVAFLSQSGALAVAILDQARKNKLGFSKIISLGNKMQLGENKLLDFLKEDKKTKVIGMYLESIEEGEQFIKLASQVAKIKPIVMLKAGKSDQAKEAMLSHTGSLAGEAKITEAAFQQAGIIEANNIREFIALIDFISKNKLPASSQTAVVTNAGGPGVLATDSFQNKKIALAEIDKKIKEELKGFLPEASALSNPIDLLGDALEDRYIKTLEILDQQTDLGAIFCLVTPQDQTPVEEIAESLINFSKKSEKIIIPVFIGGKKVKKAKERMTAAGLTVFDYPEEAIKILDSYFGWVNNRGMVFQESEINLERQALAVKIIEGAKQEKRKALNAFEAEQLMEIYQINATPISRAEGSGFDFPVVLKVDDEKYLHKTDQGGVVLNIKNQADLDKAIEKMKEEFPDSCLIVQKQEKNGEEIILGIKKDLSFGPVIAFGLGGIFTEIFKKVDFIFPGMDRATVKRSVLNSSINFMFNKFRGQKPLDIDKFSSLLMDFTTLAQELPEIKEMDVNPLFGFRDEKDFMAVDVKIMI